MTKQMKPLDTIKKDYKLLCAVIIALIIGGLIGFAIGLTHAIDWCTEQGFRIINAGGLNITLSDDIKLKIVQHLNLINNL